MDKQDLKKLTNDELDKLLNETDWCDRDLLREYDERKHDGRIQFKPIPMDDIEGYISRKYEEKRKKKAG